MNRRRLKAEDDKGWAGGIYVSPGHYVYVCLLLPVSATFMTTEILGTFVLSDCISDFLTFYAQLMGKQPLLPSTKNGKSCLPAKEERGLWPAFTLQFFLSLSELSLSCRVFSECHLSVHH
jgi:hypothetical protein